MMANNDVCMILVHMVLSGRIMGMNGCQSLNGILDVLLCEDVAIIIIIKWRSSSSILLY